MDIKKWVPWNWFKKEEENTGNIVPVQRAVAQGPADTSGNPFEQFQYAFDRLFNQAFRGLDLFPSGLNRPLMPNIIDGILKPTLDLSASEGEYTVTVEIPGVDEKDVKIEIADDHLTIRGEKKQEKEVSKKNYYRMERAYGAFQRVLSLPDDADQDHVTATFKKGVLTVTMPRISRPKTDVKQIEVKSA